MVYVYSYREIASSKMNNVNTVMHTINLAFSWHIKLVFLVKLVQDSHDLPEAVCEGGHVFHHSPPTLSRAIGAQQHQEVLVVRHGLHRKLQEERKKVYRGVASSLGTQQGGEH